MAGSHFIVQTSKFLLINVTVVTLVQGHGKVIQYISLDSYFPCPKYLRFLSGEGGCEHIGGNELKTFKSPQTEVT